MLFTWSSVANVCGYIRIQCPTLPTARFHRTPLPHEQALCIRRREAAVAYPPRHVSSTGSAGDVASTEDDYNKNLYQFTEKKSNTKISIRKEVKVK